MNEDQQNSDTGEHPWIEKLANIFSSRPKSPLDLVKLLKTAQDNDVIDQDALGIIEGAMKVSDMQVREIMVPRSQMQVIKTGHSLSQSLPQVIESAHSRYPVVGETNDEVLGILLAKDLLPQVLNPNAESFDPNSLLRPATFIPESKRLNVLLREFRENRNHMAIVIDEYGGVAGLVTIEDVLEEIVGEIEDEHDIEPDSHIKKLANNDFIVNALTPIDEFNERFNSQLNDEEFDTVGGVVLQSFGHLPNNNETTNIDGYEFKIINADRRQIHLLRMKITAEEPA